MGRFLAGFLTASVLWGIGAFAYLGGYLESSGPALEEEAQEPEEEVTAVEAPAKRRRRNRRARRGRSAGAVPMGNAVTGDDLGDDDTRSLDLGAGGGEAQLSQAQIAQGMDDGFGRIRRCLVLAAGDDPVQGRLVIGMRIDPSGAVSRVNLSGPAVVSTGECGDCLRSAVRSVRFPSFDGPPMVARYPITLD